jgi:predicted neuraminidase
MLKRRALKHDLRIFLAHFIAGLALAAPGSGQTLVPATWDAARAGDVVLDRLVAITAPQVKGAHDAEMVLVKDRAYVVAELNDTRAGESAGWPEIYCAMSIVNLKTLQIEKVIPFARSEQAFENETLPVGACFVPRIIKKDDTTLRCYFASEDPGNREAQTWLIDFDLESQTFETTIHKAKLKTAAGIFDMQPQYFHADAAANGFGKPPKDFGLYLFDSFKVFDGRTYVAINSFPGKQNALAVVNDGLDTFEIIGHYNEPQSVQLSESAVNRLPDGTWMAICRQDGGNGNYHFTTSKDGQAWTPGRELPSVPNGANSKPTFDKFGDLYYLGWQEATRIHGVSRSVFNIDVSRDGTVWERKYRLETSHSFQYPTFREHDGAIWLCVTQGDSSPSRKERIMFGKLEDTGAFESQPESVLEATARIKRMEQIADLALVPPQLNTSPLPEYDYDKLDYGMTIGIERTPGGRLWACWVAGGDSPKAFFVLATSDDDGESWSSPRLVVDSHSKDLPAERSILVGNLWTDPLGRLWLIFDQSMDMFDGRAGVWAAVCKNPDAETPTWSEPRRIWHGVTLNKPTVLSTGEWMLPISLDQREGFRQFKGCFKELDSLRGANVFVSTDQGATWERRGCVRFPNPDWHEHMIVERKDGTLWMLARTVKGITQTTSSDGGRTWSEPNEPPGIRQPNARFHVRRLASGRILLIKHGDAIDSHQGRVMLSAWLSDDEGKSWQGGLVLDERKGISYPDGFQGPDGILYISYDRNRATDGEILLARFTEEDILTRKLVGNRSKLKMLICRPLAGDVAQRKTN